MAPPIRLAPAAPDRYHPFDIEGRAMEQILIRNLPAGTKAALKARAELHRRSVEAEAREIFAEVLGREPVTIVDLLATDDGQDIEFEPERLGLTARTPDL
jgi:antitoxin FitA